jgi:hypothetical protein
VVSGGWPRLDEGQGRRRAKSQFPMESIDLLVGKNSGAVPPQILPAFIWGRTDFPRICEELVLGTSEKLPNILAPLFTLIKYHLWRNYELVSQKSPKSRKAEKPMRRGRLPRYWDEESARKANASDVRLWDGI